MTFRRSSWRVVLGAAVLALSGLLVCNAQQGGKDRPRPIEFSVPRGDDVTTNLQQSMSKPDGLKQLEEDSYKPLQSFAPPSSLDGVAVRPARPPATPAIQSKRVKELLDRQKNWVFMSPEDLVGTPTVEDILKTPARGTDGQEEQDRPAFERYYERLAIEQSAANNPVQSKQDSLFGPPSGSKSREELPLQEDSNLPSGLRQSAEALQRLFEPGGTDNPLVQGATRGSLSDTFGLGNNILSKEQMQGHKKLMEDYQSVLDPAWHPPAVGVPGSSLAIFGDMTAPVSKPAAVQPSTPSPALHHGLQALADVLDPMLGLPGQADVDAQALGQARLTPALPKVESTRAIPVAPSFDAPRRSFR